LTIEEWFYLPFPVLCYLLHKLLKSKSQAVLNRGIAISCLSADNQNIEI
jgi:hypothetical protein